MNLDLYPSAVWSKPGAVVWLSRSKYIEEAKKLIASGKISEERQRLYDALIPALEFVKEIEPSAEQKPEAPDPIHIRQLERKLYWARKGRKDS